MTKVLQFLFLILLFSVASVHVGVAQEKSVLIIAEGEYNTVSIPSAQSRQMAQLLGHFKANYKIIGSNVYKSGELNKYDFVFYIGTTLLSEAPNALMADIMRSNKTVVWVNGGFLKFSQRFDVEKKFGFKVTEVEKNSTFASIKCGNDIYTKGDPEINLVQVSNNKQAEVIATAISVKPKKEIPYMIKSGNLYYFADMPFTGADETDRYLLFCDKLHDILKEFHEEKHQAIIRIEDITPLADPKKLREIADILSERGVPFIVGVVPIYVNPGEDRRVALTERPEVVDALKYMMRNGGNIVMHGVTHQYKGISTDDAEFWYWMKATPIPNENEDDIARKIELGIDEFFKNGIYPIAWETPHYVASQKSYKVISRYFSTVIEQRMVIDNFDYGQYFPYIINKDLFGQKIYPENLGYVPLYTNVDSSRVYVQKIIKNSESIHRVRDGVVSFFFHPFINLGLLGELIDGIKAKGYTFIDFDRQTNWVKEHDKVILTGDQTYNITLDNSFLYEMYINNVGNIIKKAYSPERIKGSIEKEVKVGPDMIYVAEGAEYSIKEATFMDKVKQKFHDTWDDVFGDKNWHEAHVCALWNPSALGASYYDQSSLISMFKSVNINVDTIFTNEQINLEDYNILIVPYASVDSLTYFERNQIVRFVNKGGNLITDRKNKLIEKFGIKFLNTEIKLDQIRDKYYPQEAIIWKYPQLSSKFHYDENDEVFCEDVNGIPVVIGKQVEKGKVLYFNTAFDDNSALGYSNYPFALEYVRRFFNLSPVFKRENLEVYFEPGLRKNTSVENLVKLWVKEGIRIIHVAGWHQYPKYDYDYKRLINLAHANGLLVYAWIEPPGASYKFYTNHPEWREKNYKGNEVRPSWRYPVALTDENCLKAVIDENIKLLKDYDWDGVNLAELYFEAGKGFSQPDLFTPMHPSALKEFKAKYGYNLKYVLDSTSVYFWKRNPKGKNDVINYRINKVSYLHERFLDAITEFAKKRSGFGVMVTFMDSYFSPEIAEYHGVSYQKMLDLQKKYNIFLQPEDPQSKWSDSPNRYLDFGRFYAKRVSDSTKLLVDLNIGEWRTRDVVTPFPTLTQTGIESYHLINSAALGAPRFVIYSEASCNPQDFQYFSFASSSPVKYEYTDDGYKVSSPYSFVLHLPKDVRVIKVDDQLVIGYRENDFLVPAGQHVIQLHTNDIQGFSSVEIQPQLLSFTGNLLDIKYEMRKVNFSYQSHERAWASFNHKPTSMTIDGNDAPLDVLKGNDCFSIMLPAGKHAVEVTTGDKFTNSINITSLWSISAIAIYGTFAVIALVLMYFGLKIFRKRLES